MLIQHLKESGGTDVAGVLLKQHKSRDLERFSTYHVIVPKGVQDCPKREREVAGNIEVTRVKPTERP